MNRKIAGTLLIILLIFFISFSNYRSNYIRAPIASNIETAAKDGDATLNGEREASSEEGKSTLHIKPDEAGDKEISQDNDFKQGTSSSQAEEEKVQPSKEVSSLKPKEKEASSLPVNKPQPVVNEPIEKPITVSRGTVKTSTAANEYPLISKNKGIYGQFSYRDTSGGRIEIDPGWIAENIVSITLPGLNQEVQVHKEAADNFIQAFNYIKNGSAMINGKQVPLLSLISTMNGTFVSRHVNWNPENGLSNHSWGTAIDINASNHFRYVNPSQEPNDPNLILWEQAFKPAGFSWGNSYADSMHFELLK